MSAEQQLYDFVEEIAGRECCYGDVFGSADEPAMPWCVRQISRSPQRWGFDRACDPCRAREILREGFDE